MFPTTPSLDGTSLSQIDEMREKIVERLENSSDNIVTSDVCWSDPHGIDPIEHKTYLDQLAISVYNKYDVINFSVVISLRMYLDYVTFL